VRVANGATTKHGSCQPGRCTFFSNYARALSGVFLGERQLLAPMSFLNINSLHRSTSIPRRGDLGSSEMADTELTKATNRYVSNYQLTAC
jgi:hypothetical protein